MALENAVSLGSSPSVVAQARPAHRDRMHQVGFRVAMPRLWRGPVRDAQKLGFASKMNGISSSSSSAGRGSGEEERLRAGRYFASRGEEPTSVGTRSEGEHSMQTPDRAFTKAFVAASAVAFSVGYALAPAACLAASAENIEENHLYELSALDAASASAVALVLKPAIGLASFFMIVRIVLTWFPETKSKEFPWLLFYYTTEPVLSFTRAVFQPVGGVDISPIIWVAFLSFMNEILVGPQGILILLQNKV